MNIRLETLVAFRYFRSRRDESFISVSSLFSFIGITIGVATLIVVMSVMNGFRFELIDKIVGVNGHIIGDGGITCPGDMSKAFGGGADFVMVGSAFAGHEENPGEVAASSAETILSQL